MKIRAYGPRTTQHLRSQWRAVVGRDSRSRNATRFACSEGLRPGTGRWYAAALWHFNQH
jgi:hypothetical protein